MTERTFNKRECEYKKLAFVANALTIDSKTNTTYIVQDSYLDYGKGLMWTTIFRVGYRARQVLCPRNWQRIVLAKTIDELLEIEKDIRADEYFND